MKNLFKYIPTYGNWGGPGWSGGTRPASPSETNWNTPPIDDMDLLFKEHDKSYQDAIMLCDCHQIDTGDMHNRWNSADKALVYNLMKLPLRFSSWIVPPTNKVYATLYRFAAIVIFGLRVVIYPFQLFNHF